MKKLFLAALLAAAVMLTGCSAKGGEESVTEPTASETETTEASESAPETETEAVPSTEETEAETEPDTDTPFGNSSGGGIADSMQSDGFIAYSRDDVSKIIKDSGLTEKSLASDIESDDADKYVYRFAMINDEPAKEAAVGDESLFCSTLTIGSEQYLVIFGSGDVSAIDEIMPYCTENKVVECWGFAKTLDGVTVILPIVAGSEESGYYAVIPVFEYFGMDVSGMTYPEEPVGSDYDPNAEPDRTVDTDGELTINITGVENMDTMVRADCTVSNTYSFDAIISSKTVTVNGEDYSDLATVYFEIKSGETITDECFYINDCVLSAGDELFISAGLIDGVTYEDIGVITFEFVLE